MEDWSGSDEDWSGSDEEVDSAEEYVRVLLRSRLGDSSDPTALERLVRIRLEGPVLDGHLASAAENSRIAQVVKLADCSEYLGT